MHEIVRVVVNRIINYIVTNVKFYQQIVSLWHLNDKRQKLFSRNLPQISVIITTIISIRFIVIRYVKDGNRDANLHHKVLRGNIQGITNPTTCRLTRRVGTKRVSGLNYEGPVVFWKYFLEIVIRDAVTHREHSKRKTITVMAVVYVLKRQGHSLYGFAWLN